MDVVYFGSGSFGIPTLRMLAARHAVRAVVTQPDRPAGRGGRLTPTPIAAWAADNLPETPVLKPEDANQPQIRDRIRAFPADAWVIVAFGQKLSPQLLSGRFAINLHGSLLPRWRGAAPINAAILAGDTHTGNSVITIADRMDAGLILAQSPPRPIEPDATAGQLHDLLAQDGPEPVDAVLRAHADGTLHPRPQDQSAVTRAPKLKKQDGWVDFTAAADQCRCRVNGLSPWPAVTARLQSGPVKLLRAEPAADDPQQPGAPGTFTDPRQGLIACGQGQLRLLEVQPPGKRVMSWDQFIAGHPVQKGDRIEGGGPR